MILETIEVHEGGDALLGTRSHPWAIWVEVSQQAHRSCSQIGALLGSMEQLHIFQDSIMVIHQSVHHVGSPGGCWMMVGLAVTRNTDGHP